MMSKRNSTIIKIVSAVLGLVLLVGGLFAYRYYNGFFIANTGEEDTHLYIRTGSGFEDVMASIHAEGLVKDTNTFRWAAEKMDYPTRVKPGKYRFAPGTNNRSLINMLGGGFQEPVRIRFDNIRLKENFAALLEKQLEPDSLAFVNLFNDPEYAESFGFNPENFFSMFIPNTYEFYWNTAAEDFVSRMHSEYEKFWTDSRREKASELGMSPQEVSILASIVKGEALHVDEMPRIAGLYINRLQRGILLQADPTVIFANNDFSIRRVLFRHLRFDSPYNTYIYAGLPPGPIMMPSIASIDAVLDHETHNYIYMCAKDDFSGYHNFAVTLAEHNVNARRFQQALNERNIRQ